MYEYRATIQRVVDGDTVDCYIDLGFDTQVFKRVRFIGVNAPETRTRDKAEKEIILKSYEYGKYGRVIGELFIVSGSRKQSINKMMLAEGLVTEYDGGAR